MHIVVPVDAPSAAESVARARAVGDLDVGFSIGPRLLSRSGASIVASIAPFGPVLVDARIAGSRGAVVAAARTFAAAGADRITLGTGVGPDIVARSVEAVRPFGARIVAVPVPPEADETATDLATAGSGRGRTVSRVAAGLGDADVDVLGVPPDIGVVAQVAPGLGVVVWGIGSPAGVAECRARGAVAVILTESAVEGPDAEAALRPFIAA